MFRKVQINESSKTTINKSDDRFETLFVVCRQVLGIFAPRKQKYIRGDNAPFYKLKPK